MGFSANESSVRVDRFKESGKWYDILEIDMRGYWDEPDIFEAVKDSIDDIHGIGFVDGWLKQGGSFVCLEPHHKNSYPIMLKAN